MEETGKSGFQKMLEGVEEEISWKVTLHDELRDIYRSVKGKYFEKISQAQARSQLRSTFKYASPGAIASLSIALQEDERRMFDDNLFFESRKRIIGFLNGVYDLQTGKVREYSSSDFVCSPLPWKVPWKFNEDAEKDFLVYCTSWVGEEVAEWFMTLLAYLLFIHPNSEQIWVNFFGLGANGKSVVEELLELILGAEKTIGCDLAHINRFSGATFENRWLVIGRDSSSYVSNKATGFIKGYSGDSTLLVERKGGESHDAPNSGKLLVSTNTLIQSHDRSFGWYRRLFPVPFPHTFPRDETFKKTLFAKIPQIIRVLLHRAYLFRQNNIPLSKYIPEPVQKLREETRFLNDRVAAFWELHFHDFLSDTFGTKNVLNQASIREFDGVTMSSAYTAYVSWHEIEFQGLEVEPSLKVFGGSYGALLQTGIGKYLTYQKTKMGRILKLRPQYQQSTVWDS